MNRWSMGMAVNHAVHSVAFECGAYFSLIHIHDLRSCSIHRFDVRPASRAHSSGKTLASRQTQAAHDELHEWIANDASQTLVIRIVDA